MSHFKIKHEAYDTIENKFSCTHESRNLRKRIIKDGRISYVTQCIRCGQTSPPIKAKEVLKLANGDPIEDYDDTLVQKWLLAKHMKYQESFFEMRKPLKVEYETYLKSNDWRQKRSQVIERSNGVCEICGIEEAEQVHHWTYTRIGKENLEDLAGLCRRCHEYIHKI